MTPDGWLRSRVLDGPPHLLEAMIAAVDRVNEPRIPDALARAAVMLYQEVMNGTGGRQDAFPLLAADALLTHAFEAQAEVAPNDLASFAKVCSGRGQLGGLLS